MVEELSGFTEPVSVMLVVNTPEAEPVDTVGSAAVLVVKLDWTPVLDPDEFEATRRKMYAVSGFSPVSFAVTDTEPEPEPALPVAVLAAKLDVPYSNQ